MEFKGTKEDWCCVFTMDKKRAVRTRGGIVCILTRPSRYSGQDERYDQELSANQADQKLIASAPKLLEALQNIERLCDNQNESHELIWGIANEAIKQALNYDL